VDGQRPNAFIALAVAPTSWAALDSFDETLAGPETRQSSEQIAVDRDIAKIRLAEEEPTVSAPPHRSGGDRRYFRDKDRVDIPSLSKSCI